MFSSRKTGSASNNYLLTRSLRFRSSASAYLNRTPGSAGNRQKWTWSAWVKLGTISASNGTLFNAGTTSGENTRFYLRYTGDILQTGYGSANYFSTTNVLRDPSAWYHIVLAYDSTQATASNRILLYINGVLATYTFGTNVTLNNNGAVNNNVSHQIASDQIIPGGYFDGYMTEINFIDGQQLTPSSFGSTNSATGVWQPIKYTGTYGTNGFYLPFTNITSTTTLGNDFSGNGNNWTTNNISLTAGTTYDSMTDVPTLTSATVANYATLNPTIPKTYCTQTDGNLKSTGTSSTDNDTSVATIGVSSGKWYWEDKIGTIVSSVYPILGAGRNILSSFVGQYPGIAAVGGFGLVVGNGNIVKEGTVVTTVTALVANDVVGFALDLGALTCAIYKNNSLIYTVTSLTAGTYYPMANEYSSSNSTHNYGQQGFTYTPPTGFVALNTFNLPTPTIGATASTQANDYFDATLYTGNGTGQSITNAGSMQPDFVWVKSRTQATSNYVYDSLRGAGYRLATNLTVTEALISGVTSFNSNGFTVGTETGNNNAGDSYVGWQWRASNAAGVTNTAGSITSTVSANTTAGFSIVTYTGNGTNPSTVGHGLGVAPSFIIVKNRNSALYDWNCYHISLGNTQYIALNTTAAASSAVSLWNNTTPTSSVFTVNHAAVNTSSNTIVAYCFAQVAGYSAFGSYTGNGSSDGPFVFTGFRPKFILIRRSDALCGWKIYNTSGLNYNPINTSVEANDAGAEATSTNFNSDWLSNGFKLRTTYADFNTSGGTYIYMAFAESPFKYANAR